jgi:hypothetical protein
MANDEGPVYYSDSIAPVRRSSPGELFFIIIEARPEPDTDEYEKSGGAFVNCWVDADDLRTAERRSVVLIQTGGWKPHRFEEWSIVTRETYMAWQPTDEDDVDLRELVEQAFTDGEVCVFNTWPVDAPDADEGA